MQNTRAQSARTGISALLVCDDDDTLLRLRDYLAKSGVQIRATRQLAEASRNPGSAVVLLPDDFDAAAVTDCVSRLLARKSSPFVIVVTAMTRLFEPLAEACSRPEQLVILPKPAWGWSILELLRNKAEDEA